MRLAEYIGIAIMLCGGAGVIGARAHHFLINSHLTEAQALWFYWPIWMLTFISLTGGYYLAYGSKDE